MATYTGTDSRSLSARQHVDGMYVSFFSVFKSTTIGSRLSCLVRFEVCVDASHIKADGLVPEVYVAIRYCITFTTLRLCSARAYSIA